MQAHFRITKGISLQWEMPFVRFEQPEVCGCPLMIFFLQRETAAANFPDFIDGNEGVGVNGTD